MSVSFAVVFVHGINDSKSFSCVELVCVGYQWCAHTQDNARLVRFEPAEHPSESTRDTIAAKMNSGSCTTKEHLADS